MFFEKDGIKVITTRDMAKYFDIRHEHILKKARSHIATEVLDSGDITQEDFERNVKNYNNCTKSEFEWLLSRVHKDDLKEYFIVDDYKHIYLTEKGFSYVAFELNGDTARRYKMWYVNNFSNMSDVLIDNYIESMLNENDRLLKTVKEYVVDYRLNVEGKQNDGRYYMHYTKLVYSILGYSKPLSKKQRDVLGVKELNKLKETEDHVAQLIEKYSKEGMHYRDVYKKIKSELHPK